VLVVDGSFVLSDNSGTGGAGLVLVDTARDREAASVQCRFQCTNSTEAEAIAILRGSHWVPGVKIFTDCLAAIRLVRDRGHVLDVVYIGGLYRRHQATAHRLSVRGRKEAAQ
jgi:ribonuclease HI